MYESKQVVDTISNTTVTEEKKITHCWITGLLLRIFRHLYCGRVVQKSHLFTPKFTRPHLERTKYAKVSEVRP